MNTSQDWKLLTKEIFQLRETSSLSTQDWLLHCLALLFLKYISDLTYAQSNQIDKYFTRMPSDICWDNFVKASNLGEVLDKTINQISDANPKLKCILGQSNFSKIPERILNAMISGFSNPNIGKKGFDLFSSYAEIAESLIDYGADDEKFLGQNFTTKWITQLLARLIDPQENLPIHDPVCGTGGLLIECAKLVVKKNNAVPKFYLSGQEIVEQVYKICQINLLLHGLNNFEIKNGDTLRDPKFIADNRLDQFEIVVANPPFNANDWGYEQISRKDKFERFRYGIPPKANGDFAFVQHIIASLASPFGKAVILVSPGVLFRSGLEQNIREDILKSDVVEAAIGLSSSLLYNTNISPAILILNRNKPEDRKNKVLVIDASNEYHKLNKKTNCLDKKNIDNIVKVLQDFEEKQGVSKIISLEEIKKNDYQLNANRYITAIRTAIDIQEKARELTQLEWERSDLEDKMDRILRELGIDA
ncbi:N-6 DNA methylase [Pseudanabaena sp. 'Roaring Creek']|uniref:N-6 DNA methylase n=1 Tax=Pseudanabaena sp. 'Roaring Creek' TaxID=1681830 RepID=UPI0006D85B51|nr:N-6 DNA methylase [Pseudanabaena sp. 'Roaring Creek']